MPFKPQIKGLDYYEGGGVTDHGALTGLADDDHTQYLLVNGSRAMTGDLYETTAIIAAAGTTQATATALTKQFVFVTSGTGGVKLPTALAGGLIYFIDNDTASEIKIYPDTGSKIDGGTINVPKVLAAGKVIAFVSEGTTEWLTIYGSGAYIPSGAILPTTGITDGQIFTHTPTGRSVWMKYNSSIASWVPILNEGTTTMYVDGASGTDSQNNGGATGASAFKTIQFAVNQIAGQVGGNVIINVAAGTYTEQVTIQGKQPSGTYNLTISGVMSLTDSGTCTSATDYSSGTQSVFNDTGKSWTTNAHANKILRLTGGTGYDSINTWKNDYIIESNTVTQLTLIGKYFGVPASGTTYEILDFATLMDGNSHTINNAFAVVGVQIEIILKFFKGQGYLDTHFYFRNGATVSAFTLHSAITASASVQARGMRYEQGAICPNANCIRVDSVRQRGFSLLTGAKTMYDNATSKFSISNSLIKAVNPIEVSYGAILSWCSEYGNKLVVASDAGPGIWVSSGSFANIYNFIIDASLCTSGNGITVDEGSVLRIWAGNDIFGAGFHGIHCDSNSTIWGVASGSKSRNNGGWGMSTSLSSVGKSITTNITYSGNTSGSYTADASSINT